MKWIPCALVAILIACAARIATAQINHTWHVDRLGLLGPEYTHPSGVQVSRTSEGERGRRFSEDPFSFITGTSNRYAGGQPATAEDHWIYDVHERHYINLSTKLADAFPGDRVSVDVHVTPDGTAWGRVQLRVGDGPADFRHELWRYENGSLEMIQPEPPDDIPPDERAHYSLSSEQQLVAQDLIGTGFSANGQSSYRWRENNGQVRNIGFYDALHQGRYSRFGHLPLARFGSRIGNRYGSETFGNFVFGLSYQFRDYKFVGQTAWVDDGLRTTRIGLYDALHTSPNTGGQTSEVLAASKSGIAFGESESYSGDAKGNSVWRYNLFTGETTRVGIFDAAHTDPVTGLQESRIVGYISDDYYPQASLQYNPRASANSRGDIAGISKSYGPAGTTGQTAWIAGASALTVIGLTAPPNSPPEDQWNNSPTDINEQGHVLGIAHRPGWIAKPDSRYTQTSGGSEAAWLYNGTQTIRIGLFDQDHTRSTDGFQSTYTREMLTESGKAFGYSQRYATNGSPAGISAWIFDGHQTVRVGLTDPGHTDPQTGAQISHVATINLSGQAIGRSNALGLPSEGFQKNVTSWFYDPSTGYQSLIFDTNAAGNTWATDLMGLSDDGVVVGEYLSFIDDPVNGSMRPFRWSANDGLTDILDIILQRNPGLTLRNAKLVDPESALKGQFLITASFNQTSPHPASGAAIFLVRLIPEPSAFALTAVGIALVVLGRFRSGWRA
jgi:hypothetical protein